MFIESFKIKVHFYLVVSNCGGWKTFICPQKLYPPHSKGNQGLMPDQDPLLPLEVVLIVTNLLMVIGLRTGERLVLMAIRLALLVLDLLLWNSEEDLAEARQNKFIMLNFKTVLLQ